MERTKKALEDAGVLGVTARPQEFKIKETPIEVDLLIEEKRTVLKVIEPIKMPHDLRFIRKRNVIEDNRLLLQGDDKFTLSKQIIQGYQDAQLSPIT